MSFIWALPGFLGLSTDWDRLGWKNMRGIALDRFRWNSFSEWSVQFHQWIDSQKKEKGILMGYSFGGRLALHSACHAPQRWKGVILISTHPGLVDPIEKEKRQKEDEKWASRFEEEEWTSLIRDWNQRAVFDKDRFCFERRETDYDRGHLAHLLRKGSLAKQQDFRSQLAALPIPILWITGAADSRYCKLAESLTFLHPASCWISIEDAGHRVPWEQTERFSTCIFEFLARSDLVSS